MSKRSKILKKIKASMSDIVESMTEASKLKSEDVEWIWKRLEPHLDYTEAKIDKLKNELDPDYLPF